MLVCEKIHGSFAIQSAPEGSALGVRLPCGALFYSVFSGVPGALRPAPLKKQIFSSPVAPKARSGGRGARGVRA